MVVLNFNFVFIVLVLLQYRNVTTAQDINVQNNTASCSDKQYEARAIPTTNNNLFEYFVNKQKENGSRRRKRQAIIPNMLGLGTELLSPPRTNAQLNPGVSAQLSPGIIVPSSPLINSQISPLMKSLLCPGNKVPLSPGVIAQLSPGINAPSSINDPPGINDQMSPEIDKTIPNIKEQGSVSETTDSVKQPVQVFIIYPRDIDKDLNDIKTEQTQFIIDNKNISSIINALNPNNLENNNVVNLTATNSIPNMIALNSADKCDSIVNNTAEISTNKSSNVIDSNHIMSLSINNTNRTDISSTDDNEEDYLENYTHSSINNIAEKPLLHTSTKSDNPNREKSTVPSIANNDPNNFTDNLKKDDSSGSLTSSDCDKNNNSNENISFPDETDTEQNESRPVFSAAQFEIKPNHKPIEYIDMEKVKLDIQNTNSTKQEKTDQELENSEVDSDDKNTAQLYNNIGDNIISNNPSKVKYPCLSNIPYFYHEVLPENWGPNLNHLYNDYRNPFVQKYENMRPVFKYPFGKQNMLTYLHQKPESTPKTVEQIRDSKVVYNEKGNDYLQEYSNILPVFKYPVEMWKHQESQSIPGNYKLYNGNDLNSGYNQKGDYVLQDNRNIPSEFKYPLDANNIQLLMAYKNWYNANRGYANMRPAFQYQNVNQYVRPENLAEIYKTGSNLNDIRNINRNNDPSKISGNSELYCNNNNGYGMVNLNTEITARPKQIPCRCNQQSSLITCNGLYENQSAPIIYPTYFYYPYVYRNIST